MTVIGALLIGAGLAIGMKFAHKKMPKWLSIIIIAFYVVFFVGIGIYASLS
jgi:hypothetical protein